VPRVVGFRRVVFVSAAEFDRLELGGLLKRSRAYERTGYPTSRQAADRIAEQFPPLGVVDTVCADDDEPRRRPKRS
jgi:hypothetical protein